MAPPKRRTSRSRRNMRRSHFSQKDSPPSLSTCKRCGQKKLPHRVCIHCGYYGDREVINMEKEA